MDSSSILEALTYVTDNWFTQCIIYDTSKWFVMCVFEKTKKKMVDDQMKKMVLVAAAVLLGVVMRA